MYQCPILTARVAKVMFSQAFVILSTLGGWGVSASEGGLSSGGGLPSEGVCVRGGGGLPSGGVMHLRGGGLPLGGGGSAYSGRPPQDI